MEQKKQRHSRTTARQYDAMLEFLKQNPEMIRGNFSSTFAEHKRRADLWDNLTIKLNSDADGSGPQKTAPKWRKTWYDLKTDVKGKVSALAKHKRKADVGAPPPPELTPFQEKVASLIKTNLIKGDAKAPDTGKAPPLPELTPLQEKVASLIKITLIEGGAEVPDTGKASETERTAGGNEQEDFNIDDSPATCSSAWDHSHVEHIVDNTMTFEDIETSQPAEDAPPEISSPVEEEIINRSTPQVSRAMNNGVYRRKHRAQEPPDTYFKELVQMEKRKAVALEKIEESSREKNRLLQERNDIERERNEIFKAIALKLSPA